MDTTLTTPAEAPRCVHCHRTLHATETARWACTGCQQDAATQLGELPRLYSGLAEVLMPGRGVPLVGSRGAYGSRPPGDLDVMDLTDGVRGGVLATLVSCVRDWAETGGHDVPDWPPGAEERVHTLCGWLRFRLDWACRLHQGVGDSLHDIQAVHRHVSGRATGERGERRVPVRCSCHTVLRVTVSTRGVRCPGCGTRYGHTDVFRLPLAERSAAA